MRSILLVILSALILFSAFFVYAHFETKGTHFLTRPDSIATVAPPKPNILKPGLIKPGDHPWTEVYDDAGNLKNRFRGDEYTPQDDGSILVKNPVAEFFLPNHQKMRLTGTTGDMIMPESSGPVKSSASEAPRGGSPNRGRIHDCRIDLFNLFPDSNSDPDETIWMNNAQFDNETMLITTEAYKDKDSDRMIAADRVHVKMRGKKYDFDGSGLRLRWNDKDGRLELLEIAHGEQLVIKDASAVSGTLTPNGTKHATPQAAVRKDRSESTIAFPVGSASSLRIFRAAGALTGGIVSSLRLSAGEGTGGTEKFSSSSRTILPGTPEAVRDELGNLLEGGRPRPPFPSAQRRTRTSALQKILKLDADPASTSTVSGTLTPSGRKHATLPATLTDRPVGSALADASSNGAASTKRVRQGGPYAAFVAPAFWPVSSGLEDTGQKAGATNIQPPLPLMLVAADKSSAIGAAKSAAVPPARSKPSTPPVPYLATFFDNVRIVQGDEVLINADRMDIDFTTRNESASPATAPSARRDPAPRPTNISPSGTAPLTRPPVANTAAPVQKTAKKPGTTQPSAPPVIVYWTGKLVMFPAKGNRPMAAAGDAIVELTGHPVNIRRTPPAPAEGDDVKAARVVYHTINGGVKLFNSPSAPQVIINKIVNGKIDPQTTVTTDTLDYAVDPAGRKFAVLSGPGHATVPSQSNADKQNKNKNKKPSDEKMDVHWANGARIYFAANGRNEQAVEHMDLFGDVDVKHPQLAMQSQVLSLFFEPATKPPATVLPIATGPKAAQKDSSQSELKRVIAAEAVHCVMAGQNGKKQTIDCANLDMRTAKASDGKFYARTVDAAGAVHAYDEDQDLRASIVQLTLRPAKPVAKKPAAAASSASSAPKKIAATQGAADSSDNAAVELEQMIASENVQVINKEGSRATGSELIVKVSEDGANHVRLTGAPLASVIDAKKNVVTGPLIIVDPKTGIAHVIGAGNMHTLQEQADGSPPRPMDVAWTDRADMDGPQDRIDVLGDVIVKTLDAEGAVNTATGDRVHIDLVKKAVPATRPSRHASTQPAGKAKPANGMQMDVMKNKDARTITIIGNSAKVKSVLAAPNGVVLRQFVIIGPKIIYELLDSDTLEARTLWVPSAGQMFMGDHRPPVKPKAGAKKADDDDSSNRGDTAFKWQRQLVYSESKRNAVMTGDVIIVHQPDGKEAAQGPVRINADQVTAWFDPIKPEVKSTAKPPHPAGDPQGAMQLKHLTADGHVTITRATATLTADAVEYDPITHWMTAHGTPNADARYEDSQNSTASKSAKDMAWNTQTWNIKAAGPRIVNPR